MPRKYRLLILPVFAVCLCLFSGIAPKTSMVYKPVPDIRSNPKPTLSSSPLSDTSGKDAPISNDAISSCPLSTEEVSDGDIFNLLLIGSDRREGEDVSRSDTMILCTLDPQHRKITMTSFLRDLYVQIPGRGSDRLNAAYAYGGSDLLRRTLEENFALNIDGYAEVDFSHFMKIIDLLGGVTLELRQDEADFINKSVPGELVEGTQLLTGTQALAYTRIRNLDADGDFGRTARQRNLLSALLQRFRGAGIRKIITSVKEVAPMVSTDLEGQQLLSLASQMLPLLKEASLVSQRVPADGTYSCSTIRGMSVLTADLDQQRKFLRETLIPDP